MPQKLIRQLLARRLKKDEQAIISTQDELNELYAMKIQEELLEIQSANHKDIFEFVDLIQVAFAFAKENGFSHEAISLALIEKTADKGTFGRVVCTSLNPKNKSNKIYFDKITNE